MYKYCSITILLKIYLCYWGYCIYKTPLTFHSPFLTLMIYATKFDYIFDKISMLIVKDIKKYIFHGYLHRST